jgi:hypothetical protein
MIPTAIICLLYTCSGQAREGDDFCQARLRRNGRKSVLVCLRKGGRGQGRRAGRAAADESTQGTRDELVAGRYQSTHALFAKPCNSLGPILVTLVLPATGSGGDGGGGGVANGTGFDRLATQQEQLQMRQAAAETARACFGLMTVLPLVAACVQLFVWRWYTLTRPRMERIQQALRAHADEEEDDEHSSGVGGRAGSPPPSFSSERSRGKKGQDLHEP